VLHGLDNLLDIVQTTQSELPIVFPEALICCQQMLQITMQESIRPESVKNSIKIGNQIMNMYRPVTGNLQIGIDHQFVVLENLENNVALVAKMIVEISRRHTQVCRYMIG